MSIRWARNTHLSKSYEFNACPDASISGISNPNPNQNESLKMTTHQKKKQLNYLVDVLCRTLTTTEYGIATMILRETKSNGLAQISINQLAGISGLSARTISRILKQLLQRNIIILVEKGSSVTHDANVYRMGSPSEVSF